MRPEGWQQIDRLFQSALERQPSERAALLDEKCAGDENLRREVEVLLAAYDEAGSFIERPALDVEAQSIADQPDELLAGQTISHYRIVSQLGAGGMGEVYLAEDMALGRKVALKVLPADFTQDHARVRRFQQEAQAASALNHPNIITIYEIADVADRHLIATEFIDGETLRERIRGDPGENSGTSLPLGEVLKIGIQVAEALAAAHEAGIVHRDIKPENIMVRRRDGYLKVLDFGLAKLTTASVGKIDAEAATRPQIQTSAGLVMGTVSYMSPEQTRGEKVDARTDIWSLGVVLYELVSGRAPFDRPTPSEVIAAILEHDPPPLAEHVDDIPAELQRIISKALTKDKGQRYQTAKDLLVDLRHLQHSFEVGAEIDRSSSARATQPAATSRQTIGKALNASSLLRAVIDHKLALLISVVALALAVAAVMYRSHLITTSHSIDSIAVLPFENATGDKETEYLADGISASLINSLSRVHQLKVVPRTMSFIYKGQRIDPRLLGQDLGVAAILTGTFVQRGDKVEIQVELVDTSKVSQVWGRQYERQFSDLAIVKQEIASDVAEWLRPGLSGEDAKRLKQGDSLDNEAYNFYLRGHQFLTQGTEEAWKKAIIQFQQATAKDPNYALAWAGLARGYASFEMNIAVPSSEMLPNARAAVEHALRLDDSLAEAHSALAAIEGLSWNFSAAEREFKRAIELDPNSAVAHHFYSFYLGWVRGRFDEAMAEARRAQQLDPLSAPIANRVTQIHIAKQELEEAIKEEQKVLELDPNNVNAHRMLALVYRKQGRYEEAVSELEKTMKKSGRGNRFLSDLGVCYALAGKTERARAVLKELEEQYEQRQGLGQHVADVYAALGDKERSFAWLEKDFQSHSGPLPIIAHGPRSDILRAALSSDPRWNDLLRRIGVPQS